MPMPLGEFFFPMFAKGPDLAALNPYLLGAGFLSSTFVASPPPRPGDCSLDCGIGLAGDGFLSAEDCCDCYLPK